MLATLPRSATLQSAARQSPYAIETLFLQRWSPRAFQPRNMPLVDLHTMLEAARWAPSAHNLQPWHFIVSRRHDEHWEKHLELLHPFNAGWATNASALVFVLSQATTPAHGDSPAQPSRTHSFDAGAAWAQLALQATALGYQAHAMAGIDFNRAPQALGIPGTHRLEIAVAIGRQAEPDQLPKELREREHPSVRRPLQDMVSTGMFSPSQPGLSGAMP